jgi:hypothetical protein
VVTEAGWYLILIDSCITQVEAPEPSRTCKESKEEEGGWGFVTASSGEKTVDRSEPAPPWTVQGSGFRVQGSGFRVQGSGFRVQGSGFWGRRISAAVHRCPSPHWAHSAMEG